MRCALRRLVLGGLCAATALGCSLLVGEGLTSGDEATPGDGDGDAAAPDALAGDSANPAAPDSGPSASRYARAVLEDGPVGYWRCGEKTGTVLSDSSGKGHDAEIAAPLGATLGVAGALAGDDDGAVELDGTASIVVGDAFDFAGTVPFTFEAWVKPRSDGKLGAIFEKMVFQPSFPPEDGTYFRYDSVAPRIFFERWAGGQATNFTDLSGEPGRLPTDRFTHLVVAYDGAAPRLFVDGKLANVGAGGAPIADTAVDFVWAKDLTGSVDELAVYDRALAPARIQAHFDAAR